MKMLSFSSKMKLVTALKNYAKAGVKVFCFCAILLDFSNFFQIFSPEIVCVDKCLLMNVPVSLKLQSFDLVHNFKAFLKPLMQI